MPERENQLDLEATIDSILGTIDREREREIVSRRFGLFDRKETLEQIGELLGITRERVRQLEKAVLTRLKIYAKDNKLPQINDAQKVLKEQISIKGDVMTIADLTKHLTGNKNRLDEAQLSFLSELCPELVVIEENDDYYHSVGIAAIHDQENIKELVEVIVEAVAKIGEQANIDKIVKTAGHGLTTQHARALASISKKLASLNGQWGLVKWPTVNPKNIRDKIYVILKEQGKHMHFNEIADSIKKSDFKRKDVTTQAIHNELIKDRRFVLIGRGIYALREWGYEKGTVADIIASVLKEANKPLHRDEIIKEVLKSRFVKETTILLNLQGKNQFKRVAKATYALSDQE